jgi:hypothetical protein
MLGVHPDIVIFSAEYHRHAVVKLKRGGSTKTFTETTPLERRLPPLIVRMPFRPGGTKRTE